MHYAGPSAQSTERYIKGTHPQKGLTVCRQGVSWHPVEEEKEEQSVDGTNAGVGSKG